MARLRRLIVLVIAGSLLAACSSGPAGSTTSTAAPVAQATAPPTSQTTPPATISTAEATTASTPEAATTSAAQAAPAATAEPEQTPAPAQTATAGNESEEAIIAGIQEAVDNFNAAYSEGDQEKLLAAIDQKNSPFRRVMLERFNTAMESQFSGRYMLDRKVTAVRDRGNGYYEATITTDGGQTIRKWVFKKIGGKWLLTEPRRADLGKRLKYTTEHFEVEYYKWDEEVIAEIGRLLENAYTTVKEKLGKVPEDQLHATISPTYEAARGGISGGNWAARYIAGSGRAFDPDRIEMRSPLSFAFGAYDATEGFAPWFQGVVTHELTHLVVNRMFGGNARLGGGFNWMSEGIADHVAGLASPDLIVAAIRQDALIPIKDKSGATKKQDLENIYLLERDVGLGYAQGYELVDFIYTQKGGYDGWWKFVDAFAKRQDMEAAIEAEFGMSLEEFEAKYHEFMKQKYNVD